MAWCWSGDKPLSEPMWPRDDIWRHRSGSTLVQVMACCLTAPSRYLNHGWLLISEVLCNLHEIDFTVSAQSAIMCSTFKNCTFKITTASPRGQWVKVISPIIHSMPLSFHITTLTWFHCHSVSIILYYFHSIPLHSFHITFIPYQSFHTTAIPYITYMSYHSFHTT